MTQSRDRDETKSSNPGTKTRPGPSNLKTKTRPSPSNLKTKTRQSPSNLKTKTRLSPSNLKTRRYRVQATSRPRRYRTKTRLSPSNLKTKTRQSPSNLKTKTRQSPSNLKTKTRLSPSNHKTKMRPSPSNLKTKTRPSPSNLETKTRPSPSNLETKTRPSPSNLKTNTKPSPRPTLGPRRDRVQETSRPRLNRTESKQPQDQDETESKQPQDQDETKQPQDQDETESKTNLRTKTRLSPSTLRTKTKLSPSNLKTKTKPSPSNHETKTRPSPSNLKTKTRPSPSNLKTKTKQSRRPTLRPDETESKQPQDQDETESKTNLRTKTRLSPSNLKTKTKQSPSNQDETNPFKKYYFNISVTSKENTVLFVLDRFMEQTAANPDKLFIVFENERYTYAQTDARSNQLARALQRQPGYRPGDTVALFMGNEPAFLFTWLALAKLGSPAALLNHNIRTKSLLHCFSCSGPRDSGFYRNSERSVGLSTAALASITGHIQESGCLHLHIRTTGLPKAAVVNQTRLLTALAVLSSNGVSSDDVIYLNLPLYHTAGFIIGFIGSIETGSTIILRRKFSASQFWDDCRRHSVTVIQYIGEVMRYLCSSPQRENDRDHKVRLAIGNGIRAEKLFPFVLIKYDTERDEPLRGANGLCVSAPKGETGLLVSKITDLAPFEGYAQNQEQTEKKRLRDVLRKGDLYFNSGDLMRIDQDNFIYFQDRVGDTFRWKGENVATTEVSDILTICDSIKEANVYGVCVPGHEGRIGMAAVTLKEDVSFDGRKLYSHVTEYLPSYARPRFLRIQGAVEVTGTFKQIKVKLVQQGFDPGQIHDPLFVLDDREKSYATMTTEMYNSIVSGLIKL
ncbi:hypothetical protein WMY93_012641 [Mugilogobius chulae]|uniref:long-chain-fatty-acid--CoA ligase n=1 Tax=Mugilogobius chulae TaxID=88201 RepID=A0AAW0P1G4_9GOBI